MAKTQRRVVTGHDAQGRSVIVMDSAAPNSLHLAEAGGLQLTELWMSDGAPADNGGNRDAAIRERQLEPAENGTVFRVIEYPPDSVRRKSLDPQSYRMMGAPHASLAGPKKHPGMHKTNTLDYVIVLSGEVYAVMDEGEVLLQAGDMLIQRGTNHAWSNRTESPCIIAFVLVSAKPLA
ncbi:MAG: cupin domain-containing protein [Betaproteobacteria bacterium]|nr:cupin domain-containing protein [Betaproteobacteria bacterium]